MSRNECITTLILLGLVSDKKLKIHTGYGLKYYHPLGGVEIYVFANTANLFLRYSHTTNLTYTQLIKELTEHLTDIKGEDSAIVPRPK